MYNVYCAVNFYYNIKISNKKNITFVENLNNNNSNWYFKRIFHIFQTRYLLHCRKEYKYLPLINSRNKQTFSLKWTQSQMTQVQILIDITNINKDNILYEESTKINIKNSSYILK